MLRRLNAEAGNEHKFNPSVANVRIEECARRGHATGPAGFETNSSMAAILLPRDPGERPLALALVHPVSERIDPEALVGLLQRSVERCLAQPRNGEVVQLVSDAA
jgi:hypothetical protein